jgi:DegV family protein with EDD domain
MLYQGVLEGILCPQDPVLFFCSTMEKDKGAGKAMDYGGNIEIITDSIAQVPSELARELGIHVIPSAIILDGQKYLDGVDLDPEILYQRMRDEKLIVQTTSPTVGQFYQVFQERLQAGAKALLYVGMSSRLSATFSTAEAAANLVLEEYPGRQISLFDSRIATIAQGFIAIQAARLARQGSSPEQVLAYIEKVRQRVGLVATLETLEYLARGGRIGKAAYMLGSLIQICPVVTIDEEGVVVPIARVRGKHEVLEKIVTYTEEQTAGSHNLHIAVMEASAPEAAARLGQLVQERLHPDSLLWTQFTSVMVAHAGPGIVGLAYYYE